MSRSRSALSRVRTRAIASASPVTLHASTTSGRARSVSATCRAAVAGREEELDERLGRAAERVVVDDRGEAAQRAARAQAVDAALDRRRG